MYCIKDTSNTTNDVHSTSLEIVDSNNSYIINDRINKCPYPFIFDIFAEDNNELINNGQPPAKRQCRASSASSSVYIKQARTPPVVNLLHSVELYAGFTRKEETIKSYK